MGTIAQRQFTSNFNVATAFLDREISHLKAGLVSHYPNDRLTFNHGNASGGFASFHVAINGVQYGRVTFKDGEVYNVKHYKPTDYPFDENDPGEILFLLIKCYYAQRHVPSPKAIKDFIERAKTKRTNDLNGKHQYRHEHPSIRRRKPLQGKNLRFYLYEMLLTGRPIL